MRPGRCRWFIRNGVGFAGRLWYIATVFTAGWNPFLRFPRLALAITLVAAAPLVVQLARVEVSADARALLAGDERNLSSYEKVRDVLAGTELVLVSLEHEDLFTEGGVDTVRRVSEAFARLPEVADVKSLTHSFKPVRRGLGFEMVPFVPPGPLDSNALTRLRQFCLTHPLVRNLLVSSNGRHTLLTVTFPRPPEASDPPRFTHRTIDAVLEPFRAEGRRFTVLALPLVENEIRDTLAGDLRRFIPAALGLLLGILWLTFRSWGWLLLVLINQLALLLVLPGMLQLAGFRFNLFSVMLVPLLTGIQLTLLTHLFSMCQQGLARGGGADAALADALRMVLKPAAFATLTTIVGLLSLMVGGVRPTTEFGLMGALGLGLVHALTFGPGLALLKLASGSSRFRASDPRLSVPPRDPEPARGTGPDADRKVREPVRPVDAPASAPPVEPAPFVPAARWPGRLLAWVGGRAVSLWVAGAAVLLATGLGLRLVRTDIRAVEFLNPQSSARQSIEHLDHTYGGINVVQIEFDTGRTNGVNDLGVLRYLESVHREAERRPEFTGVYSYPLLLAMMNQLWEGERPGTLRLPDSPWLVQLFVLALRRYDFPFLTALADPAHRTAYLVLRTSDLPAERYLRLIEEVVGFANAQRPPGVTVSAARGLHSLLEADRRIVRNQLGSVGLTFGVIGLVLALLWRSPGLALLAVAANAVPVAFVVALAGFLRVPLNSITVMVAAISLGIAVDNAIHFITHWREQRQRGVSARAATEETLRVKGRAILWAGTILVAVFGVFWCSSFPPVVHFGLLSAAAFLGGLVGVLVFIPAVLCRWR